MKLYKPSWVNHDDKPIYSLDIHPDGERFATGGQGNESGLVVIWNLVPVLSAEAEADKSVPKILCQMDNHISCVNSVRWSTNGTMLASGGVDKIVMIWKRGKGSGGVFGSSGLTKNKESWRCISTLRGHGGDVLDLAWSPQDQWLASCSVDNTIIIWDIQSLPSIVARLKGHTGLVKGVTWDPVGKFLASQSDDRSVRIWKTSDWSCQKSITEPFEECGGTTHVLRLSWSPDGQYLVSAHAMNGGGPTAQIIDREGWKCDKDFVGHRKAVTCVRFHNSILKRQAPKSNKSQQYCCVAVGSRDRSLSVWMTALQRPLVVIHDLFEDSILDLSWSAHGYILLACSVDGTVVSLQFSANELGTPLTEDGKNSLYQRMYGKSANIDMSVQGGKDMIIENAELLNVTNDKPKPPVFPLIVEQVHRPPIIHNSATMVSSPNVQSNHVEIKVNGDAAPDLIASTKPISKQIETRTPDGKRRITPMFIPLNPDIEQTPEFSSSSRSTTNIVTEKMNSSSTTDTNDATVATISKTELESTPASLPPVLPQPDNSTACATVMSTDNNDTRQLDTRLSKPAPVGSQIEKVPLDVSNQPQAQPSSSSSSHMKAEQISYVVKPLSQSGGKAVPLKGSFVKSAGDLRVQVVNASLTTTFGPLSKIGCFNASTPDNKLWETFIGSPIVNFSCCIKYALFCSIDGTVRFLNMKTGISVLPVLNLPSAAVLSAISTNCQLAGVLSECGSVRVWDVDAHSIYITASCCELLKGGYPQMMSITENGYPFISLSNGCAYSYSKKLDSWLVLNSRDPIVRHGLTTGYNAPSPNIAKNMKLYPLLSFQSSSQLFHAGAQNYVDLSASSWQSVGKQSFIENQIELCKQINSPEELRHWYSTLGYHLAFYGTESRIRLLLDDLLGSFHHMPSNRGGNAQKSHILGIDKHVLLKDILEHLKAQHQWQRLWMEYSEQLNLLEKQRPSPAQYSADVGGDTKMDTL